MKSFGNPPSLKQHDMKSLLTSLKDELKRNNATIFESHFTVTKRNGQLSPFRRSRIYNAIEAAFRDTKQIGKEAHFPEEIKETVEGITNLVIEQLIELAVKGVSLSVEGIQDVVEVTLMKEGYHDVARDYIIYRDEHKKLREDSPLHLKVIRKDGQAPVRFNPIKIASAIEKQLRIFHQITSPTPEETVAQVNQLTKQVVDEALVLADQAKVVHMHQIQDLIEHVFMKNSLFDLAKQYILYRASRGEHPEKTSVVEETGRCFSYVTSKGAIHQISEVEMMHLVTFACRDLPETNPKELFEAAIANFYEGIKEHEIPQAFIMAARARVEREPSYAKVASRLLLDVLFTESMGIRSFDADLKTKQQEYLHTYIEHGISIDRLSPRLREFDLDKIAKALDPARDDLFMYLGLQTLYDRYFIHDQGRRLETPQIFWMRVSMGLALNEHDKTGKAIEFYNVLSQFLFVSSTPTLFNSGTLHSQLSSCFLSTVMDDLHHIFKVVSDDAMLSKWSGGLGNDWTSVRGTGAVIKGTNGKSQGVIPFLKVANDTAVAVNQGGKRKGAMCAYLETWHIDIQDFLELRKNTGDERRRTHDMNTANWIPDLFMKRVRENGEWTLFSPDEVPDLHDLYGAAFEARYTEYEKMAQEGKIRLFKKIEALGLWRKMLSMLFETGHPWITFKDPSNIRSPQDHVGVVHSSNLCTEILLNTSRDEVAVCNLGSINLALHLGPNGIDEKKLARTVKTAIRMLDNVIDINYYPIPETRNANLRHRPIGLGLMGFQDALYMLNMSYASHDAIELADKSMEMISYYAILASSELAKERGSYESYKGSKWDRGLLPIDTIEILETQRGLPVSMDRTTRMNWDTVREHVRKYGMRNSNTMAIAPTATIANIAGVTSSIEPTFKNLYAKSNLSGEFTVVNEYLVEDLKKLGMWNDETLDDLKYFDGSLLEIEYLPESLKQKYLTCFEIEPEWIIRCAAKRQKWIDMGQSLNLYIAQPSGKKLHEMYLLAWESGLKTTYYLRSIGATQVEKSTTDINKRGLQPRWMKNESPSARVKVERNSSDTPKACSLEEGCESCQ